MKLYSSSRSPYVRKVLIAAHELGLIESIQRIDKVVSTLVGDDEVATYNPLGQIPTLVLDDGRCLYDSTVICEFLHQQRPEAGLIPSWSDQRLEALRHQAAGDGVMEAFMRWYGERRREIDPASPDYVAAFRGKMVRCLDDWERSINDWSGRGFDVGQITFVCVLSYADFRFAGENWRAGRPRLAEWFAAISQRPSVRATAFEQR